MFSRSYYSSKKNRSNESNESSDYSISEDSSEDYSEDEYDDMKTIPNSLSKIEKKLFRKTFKISAKPLRKIVEQYRDGAVHYWHPETKWIYSTFGRLRRWKSHDYKYLLGIANRNGLELDASSEPNSNLKNTENKDTKEVAKTEKHNLSPENINMFEKIFNISAEPLQKIIERYKDLNFHYWHPETKWIYSISRKLWKLYDYNYLLEIASKNGLELNKDSDPKIDSDTINAIYKSEREALCEKNSSKKECCHSTENCIYYYKLSSRPTQQFCTYCKENCIKITKNEKWSDKIISSGFFDCTCGDCNCDW